MRFLFILFILGISACGKSSGRGGNDSATGSNSFVVQDTDSLPACDAEREGQLAYIKQDKTLRACDGTSWTLVQAPSSYAVKDGVDNVIGTTLPFLIGPNSVGITLRNGYYTSVDHNTGKISYSCAYESTDCSGPCLTSSRVKLVLSGPSDKLYEPSWSAPRQLTPKSAYSTPEGKCFQAQMGESTYFTTTEFQFKDVQYPFPLPFSYEASL